VQEVAAVEGEAEEGAGWGWGGLVSEEEAICVSLALSKTKFTCTSVQTVARTFIILLLTHIHTRLQHPPHLEQPGQQPHHQPPRLGLLLPCARAPRVAVQLHLGGLVVVAEILDPARPGLRDDGPDGGDVRRGEAEEPDTIGHVQGDAGEARAEGGEGGSKTILAGLGLAVGGGDIVGDGIVEAAFLVHGCSVACRFA
jgi:hypothetical protein